MTFPAPQINCIVGVPLFLHFFCKEVDYSLSALFLCHALKKTTITRNVLASDELVHFGLHLEGPSLQTLSAAV
jgi:hypothetical protein